MSCVAVKCFSDAKSLLGMMRCSRSKARSAALAHSRIKSGRDRRGQAREGWKDTYVYIYIYIYIWHRLIS